MRRTAILMILLLLLPGAAMAGEFVQGMPYEAGSSLYWQQLSPGRRELFEQIYPRLMEGETHISFSQPADYDDVSAVMVLLHMDYPQLCGLGNSWTIEYYQNSPQEATGLRVSQGVDTGRAWRLLEYCRSVLSGMPEDILERELAIHELICDGVTYGEGTWAHDAWGALMEGRAVCDGYAGAMVLLCRMSGIPASVITGQADGGEGWFSHAWVMLDINGTYTQTDITWNDQSGQRIYDYYNISDAMAEKSHIRGMEAVLLPVCSDEGLTWHALTGNAAPSGKGLSDFLRQKLTEFKERGSLRLRFASDKDMDTALDFFRQSVSFSYYIDKGQHCLSLFSGQ